jgi:maltose alpha-D-glucosyltransferase / alpha-amylase
VGSWPDRLIEYMEDEGRVALADYLPRQRWFGAKGKRIVSVHLHDHAVLPGAPRPTLLAIVTVQFNDGPTERYVLFLVMTPHLEPNQVSAPDRLFNISHSTGQVSVTDATADTDACLALVHGIRDGLQWPGRRGTFRCVPTSSAGSALAIPVRHAKRLSGEQSNTSIVFDQRVILKVIRTFAPGVNPDREILEFLTTRTRYQSAPPLMGSIEYQGPLDSPDSSECSATVGLLQTFLSNEGDGWSAAIEHINTLLRDSGTPITNRRTDVPLRARVQQCSQQDVTAMRRLGAITAELHVALSSDTIDPAFRPERITEQDISVWHSGMASQMGTVFGQLRDLDRSRQAHLQLTEEEIASLELSCGKKLDGLRALLNEPVTKIRVHGDYHLGQVLKKGEEFIILDFEGEPARRLAERRAKQCALKDVAGMLRSFNYAACAALREGTRNAQDNEIVTALWEQLVTEAFWGGYTAIAQPGQVAFMPGTRAGAQTVLRVFELDKTIYEIGYELNNRPDWLDIPLNGLRRILGRRP